MVTFAMKLEDARKTGREEGREEGRRTGAWEKAISTAKKALKHNIPLEVIADLTSLPAEEISSLSRSGALN